MNYKNKIISFILSSAILFSNSVSVLANKGDKSSAPGDGRTGALGLEGKEEEQECAVENIIEILSYIIKDVRSVGELSYVLYGVQLHIPFLSVAYKGEILDLDKRIDAMDSDSFEEYKEAYGREIIELVKMYLQTNPDVRIVEISIDWLKKARDNGEIVKHIQKKVRQKRQEMHQVESELLEDEYEDDESAFFGEDAERDEKNWRYCADRMAEIKSRRGEFIAKFLKYLEDGVDFPDNPPNYWCEYFRYDAEIEHRRFVEFIKKSPRGDVCARLYAEFAWMAYVLRNFTGENFRINSGLEWLRVIFKCFYNSQSPEERFFSHSKYGIEDVPLQEILDFMEDLEVFYRYDYKSFEKSILYDLMTIDYIKEIVYSKNSLKHLGHASEMANGLGTRLEELKKVGEPTIGVLAQGMQELLLRPLEQEIEVKMEKLQKGKREKEVKSFDESKGRYVPCGKGVGSGSFGNVSVYWDTKEKKKVAVKVLDFGGSFNERTLEKMQKIRSDYVAQALDLIDLGDRKKGLVMEYVHGGVCLNYAVQRFTDRNQLLEVCIQLAKAFKAFADAGVTHGDLSHYGNILLDSSGNVKIIDYDTACGVFIVGGTPEQFNMKDALNQIGAVTLATDEGLYDDICDRLGIRFIVLRQMQRPIDTRLEMPMGALVGLTFEKLIQTLEDMKSKRVSADTHKADMDEAAA